MAENFDQLNFQSMVKDRNTLIEKSPQRLVSATMDHSILHVSLLNSPRFTIFNMLLRVSCFPRAMGKQNILLELLRDYLRMLKTHTWHQLNSLRDDSLP